jgi:7,8-dihydropterin-6-yl-methyl-4-(beta-D-ribofuranosyl)aminobenzene 5'-phosphate synthase
MIQPVESLEITVLADNGTDSLSTNPGFVETDMAGAWRRGMKWLSGRCLCCAAHGRSCLITTRTPSSQHTLLFEPLRVHNPPNAHKSRSSRRCARTPGRTFRT